MKIGAAIIACDRFEYTKQCLEALLNNRRDLSEVIIVNDGQPFEIPERFKVEVLNNTPPYQTVGFTKDKGLKELLKRGCDEIFIIENDILVQTPEVFKAYIDTAKATGVLHLNFGYHGPANKQPGDYNKPAPRAIVEYGNGIKLALNLHSVGAFSYYNKRFIEEVGYHDAYFKNAWEHVELCQRAISKGLLPAFWWFPDVEGSDKMLVEIAGSIQNSSITHTDKWNENMRKGAEHYKKKHGWIPIQSPDTVQDDVMTNLKTIYKKYKCS